MFAPPGLSGAAGRRPACLKYVRLFLQFDGADGISSRLSLFDVIEAYHVASGNAGGDAQSGNVGKTQGLDCAQSAARASIAGRSIVPGAALTPSASLDRDRSGAKAHAGGPKCARRQA